MLLEILGPVEVFSKGMQSCLLLALPHGVLPAKLAVVFLEQAPVASKSLPTGSLKMQQASSTTS